jgi:hypothetical protein
MRNPNSCFRPFGGCARLDLWVISNVVASSREGRRPPRSDLGGRCQRWGWVQAPGPREVMIVAPTLSWGEPLLNEN